MRAKLGSRSSSVPILRAATAFWLNVKTQADGCWEWQGARQLNGKPNEHGYGAVWDGERVVGAHRLAWRLIFGAYPSGHVLHRCDNPPCVRPDHLWEGTHAENMADMMGKHRSSAGRPRPSAQGDNHWVRRYGVDRHGENAPGAILTRQAVAFIRANYAPRGVGGMSGSTLARDLGVSPAAISKIIRGINWAEKREASDDRT